MTNALLILTAIGMLESGGDPAKINRKEQAYGLHQIRISALTDVNRRFGTMYSLADCLDPKVSTEVAYRYCTMYGAKTAAQFAGVIQAGPGGKAPKEYVKRMNNLLRSAP